MIIKETAYKTGQKLVQKCLIAPSKPLGIFDYILSIFFFKHSWMNEGLVTGNVYFQTTREQLAYWPVLYNLFIENFCQEVFRQIRCYFPELFRQITYSKRENWFSLSLISVRPVRTNFIASVFPRLRISCDTRWQSEDKPVDTR